MTTDNITETAVRYPRVIEKTISTPAAARQTARWAIRAAKEAERGRNFPLIAARMFSIFMLDGVVHHIGEKLYPHWNTKPAEDEKSPAWERLEDRHKMVRRAIGLDNGNKEYEDILYLIRRLTSFRNQFAHPREINEILEDTVASPEEMNIPNAAWEQELVDPMQVEKEFEVLETYCIKLLDNAADFIESQQKADWVAFYRAYPNMNGDGDYHATMLRGFLHSTSTSTWSVTLPKKD